MGKKSAKNGNQPPQKNEAPILRDEADESRELHVGDDRSARHLSEIDRREGEMNHGETGGNFRHFDEPGRA